MNDELNKLAVEWFVIEYLLGNMHPKLGNTVTILKMESRQKEIIGLMEQNSAFDQTIKDAAELWNVSM